MTAVLKVQDKSNDLLSNYKTHKSYDIFISSLRSKHTRIKYDGCLQKYLKLPENEVFSSLEQIVKKDSKLIENEIIGQLIEMKRAGLSYSTLAVYLAAITSFFSINDIVLNRRKLSKFLGEQENKYEYRSYTHAEISKLLSLCDLRGKVIVLLLASTGMRIGALPELRFKHLKRLTLTMAIMSIEFWYIQPQKNLDIVLFAALNAQKQ